MNGLPMPAVALRIAVIHGGDAAGHQRRVQEWLDQNQTATVIQIQFVAFPEDVATRKGAGFSTMMIYTD